MSHANGEVFRNGELVAHFEYNGTVDVARPNIYESFDDMRANWRGSEFRHCTCAGDPEKVILWTSYGSGFYWNAEACFKCMVLVRGLDSEDSTDGRPFP